MYRTYLFLTCALFGAALLAGCDATSSASDALDASLGDLNVALEEADQAFAALAANEQTDEAYIAVINEALARHFGADAPTVKVAGAGTEATFGPFNIAFDQTLNHTGQLAGPYPGTFDVYLYDLVGTQTGAFETAMTVASPTTEIGGLLRINGRLRDRDSNRGRVTVETQPVTAPARAVVGVAYLEAPPGGFPAGYQLESQFDNL
jgi:hypothetical protein